MKRNFMKKILVPCDFSSTAIQAFRFACEIATVSKGEVFLLNVIELPFMHNSLLVPIQMQACQTSLDNMMRQLNRWVCKLRSF